MRLPAALLCIVAPAACQQAPADSRGVARDETLLTVSASGRAESRPDEARLQLGVQSIAAGAGEASRANRTKMDRVNAALARLGVSPDDIQTRNLSLHRIDHGPERGRFRADNVIEVRLRNMARVGEAVTLMTEAGANLLSGPDLRIADPEGANRPAYAAAYRAARARADAYAEAAGLQVRRVLAIHDGGEGHGRRYAPYVSGDSVAQTVAPPPAEETPFSPGVNRSEVRVRVDFALSR